jgi:hypothetical protein
VFTRMAREQELVLEACRCYLVSSLRRGVLSEYDLAIGASILSRPDLELCRDWLISCRIILMHVHPIASRPSTRVTSSTLDPHVHPHNSLIVVTGFSYHVAVAPAPVRVGPSVFDTKF